MGLRGDGVRGGGLRFGAGAAGRTHTASGGECGRRRGAGRSRRADEHAGDARQLEHFEDPWGGLEHLEGATDCLELLVILQQHPDAGGAEVVNAREFEVHLVITRLDRHFNRLTDPVGPVRIEAP